MIGRAGDPTIYPANWDTSPETLQRGGDQQDTWCRLTMNTRVPYEIALRRFSYDFFISVAW